MKIFISGERVKLAEKSDLEQEYPGLFVYDLRHGDDGDICSIEPSVMVNHYGTLYSNEEIELPVEGSWASLDYDKFLEEFEVEQVETFEDLVDTLPPVCPHCSHSLNDVEVLSGMKKNYTFDSKTRTYEESGDIEVDTIISCYNCGYYLAEIINLKEE